MGVESDNSPENQLPSPTNEDRATYHPEDSRGRRLFPLRRPSIPCSVRRNANAVRGCPQSEISHSMDHSPIDRQEYNSQSSSPSSADSVNTVKVYSCPTLERLFSQADPKAEENASVQSSYLSEPLPDSRSVKQSNSPHHISNRSVETSFCAPSFSDTPARGNLQWKSMAQFHRSRYRLRPRALLQLSNGKQMGRVSDASRDPLVPTMDSFDGNLPSNFVPRQWSRWSNPSEMAARPKVLPIESHQNSAQEEYSHVATYDQGCPDVSAFEIATFDCTVKLSTVATVTSNGNLHINHLVLLSVINPMEESGSLKVGLSFLVTNALHESCIRSLGPSQSSILFKQHASQFGLFPREGAELVVVRDRCDVEEPISLYFAFTYPSPCQSVTTSLPTFRPKEGKSLSELVFIAEPLPSLSMKTFVSDSLSSWKSCHHPVSQVTCYERIDLPRLYPASFQDDLQMRLVKLAPVRFRALGGSSLSNVVQKLEITVYDRPGQPIECGMSFVLEIGVATALVSLDPNGWEPRYFIVDGRVATEMGGECWTDKEGHITIFRDAHMAPGPIMVETYWQGLPKQGKLDGRSTAFLPLPTVMDRKVLGGKLTWQDYECKKLGQRNCPPSSIVKSVVLLNHLGEKRRMYDSADGTCILLPTMDAGYKILHKRAAEAGSQYSCCAPLNRHPSPPIREHTRLFAPTARHSDAKAKMDDETGLDSPAKDLEGAVMSPRETLKALSLALLLLLLLVPGLLLFVDHVRRGNDGNEPTSRSDEHTMSGTGIESRAILDAVDLDPLQPAVSGPADSPVEGAKCEGWRDWVYYGSGWRGCLP